MANRVKEDEKNERIIRGLLKLPENRRCINCNSLGPQYVCTNFLTFICTTCSGIHREFTHRVKSVSMAKFTSQEVNALQEGGNQRAKEIYLKEWDPQRNSFPDSSNVERLRDFIKHVYVDRRYNGERNFDKPPRVKMGEKDESYESRRTDSYQGGSRSPPYEDNERRYNEKSSPGARSYEERRSPGYDQEIRQYGDHRKSPARPEVVNDWRRDDRFGNGRRQDDRRMSDGDLKLEGRSPERPKDLGASSPPVVRPVREILGENTIPLRISEPPKPTSRTSDVPAQTQRTVSSSSLGSASGNPAPAEVKVETSRSLIDFDADPEPPIAAAAAAAPEQQPAIAQSTSQPANAIIDNNWASFDAFPQAKVSQAPIVNPLESVLSQLSVPAPAPHSSGAPGHTATMTTSVNNLLVAPLDGVSVAAPVSTPVLPVNGGNTLVNMPGAMQWPTMQQQQQPSLFPAAGNQSSGLQFQQPVTGPSSFQPWNFPPAPNSQGLPNNLTTQAPPSVLQPAHDVNSAVVSQPSAADVKSSGRMALPEDLFAVSYPAFRAPVPGWQTGQPGGMGFPIQYNTAVPMHTFQQSSKSTNPFDLNSEHPPVQVQTFPSMQSLQGALPNVMNPSGMPPSVMQPSGLIRTSSLGAPQSAWMPQSYTPAFPPQAPQYGSALPPRAYMGQQVPNMLPSGHQAVGGVVPDAFGSLNVDQQMAGRFSAPATPTPFPSVGGNPFG
ncbi:probable ADP-ribosylation factor GTPase-activating protein AGD14 isoform X2 [Humulus lupulus]|nr:probable ADP-ribosylation factor GTPase-activating protein AGD14 isoform X2 [Humulus lupulus]XP_062090734.1 probable ADP-ribosylation factor GTPase-activating protein AGD14 isoform X2 [Humulus lupulus]XP_062090735.1 probable ADP-ribosylation factor GTPase-activating protein AGD14 isoform X2 [Humulus lupulus]